ncbi:hypothetical protein ANTRET_LOCUS7750 [Anthophora retusa]
MSTSSLFRTWPNEFVPNAIRNLSLTLASCETNALTVALISENSSRFLKFEDIYIFSRILNKKSVQYLQIVVSRNLQHKYYKIKNTILIKY